ncbi:aspartate aminotransferase family protein [Proteiniclasticum sp. C24MP]|uniref:aspartate aminotransferase family protein n=1 Tax=Proteiniclasticum sp. C24MP TaxID=3374101 RepID=UPI00375507BE
MTLMREDQNYVLNLYKRIPLEIARGEGMYLYDREGNRYLDFYSGIAVNTLGHGHPAIADAIREQMDAFLHLSNYFTTSAQVSLAKKLVENSFASKVYFANSGAEANEAMLKLARKYGQGFHGEKTRFVSVDRGFHGRTMGSMSVTGNGKYKDQFGKSLQDVVHIPLNDVDALREAVDENTCGIIFEIIQGEGGLRQVTEEFIAAIREEARKHHALILVDEVQTGLMRTGNLFSHEAYGLTPDAMTLAKGLGGGLPIGAMLVHESVEDVLKPGDHGSTFGGNPVACAAGNAMLSVLLEEGFKEELKEKSGYLLEGLEMLMDRHPLVIREIRGEGLMLGLVVGAHAERVKERALEHHLLLNVTGNEVVRLLPALILSREEIDLFIETMDDVLSGI